MLQIRPISDLRNKFSEIENIVQQGQPIYFTKNGYGSMVVMSLEYYSMLTDTAERKLDEADYKLKVLNAYCMMMFLIKQGKV